MPEEKTNKPVEAEQDKDSLIEELKREIIRLNGIAEQALRDNQLLRTTLKAVAQLL